jgi:ribose transport system substrate-binding protein
MKTTRTLVGLVAVVSILAGACGTSTSSSGPGASAGTSTAASVGPSQSGASARDPGKIPILAPADRVTVSPWGETGVPANQLVVSDADLATIKTKNLKMALIWYTTEAFFTNLNRGIQKEADRLGIKIVAQTDYQADMSRMKNDVETVMALKPDIILTLVADPAVGAEALKPAVDAGVKIVMLSSWPNGWKAGKEAAGFVMGDKGMMGRRAIDMLAKALGYKGNVAFIYCDYVHFSCNRQDQLAKTSLIMDYPNMVDVAEGGFADRSQTEQIASAIITQHPEINGFYVADSSAADGVLAAIRAANRPDIKLVTVDLGLNEMQDMASCGSVVGLAAEYTADMGVTLARVGALAAIGRPVPGFTMVDALSITRDNLEWAQQTTALTDLPQVVKDALAKPCPTN